GSRRRRTAPCSSPTEQGYAVRCGECGGRHKYNVSRMDGDPDECSPGPRAGRRRAERCSLELGSTVVSGGRLPILRNRGSNEEVEQPCYRPRPAAASQCLIFSSEHCLRRVNSTRPRHRSSPSTSVGGSLGARRSCWPTRACVRRRCDERFLRSKTRERTRCCASASR